MKIAILNDTHCGIRNASQIFLDNAKDFYENIFFPECEKRGIKQILHLGDYYDHRKYINFKVLNHNRNHFLNKVREKVCVWILFQATMILTLKIQTNSTH